MYNREKNWNKKIRSILINTFKDIKCKIIIDKYKR
jgi:hypothetical protein